MIPNPRPFYLGKEYRTVLFSRVLCCISNNGDAQLSMCTTRKAKRCKVLAGLIETYGEELKENMEIQSEAVYEGI